MELPGGGVYLLFPNVCSKASSPSGIPPTHYGPKGWVDCCLESTVGLGWGMGVSIGLPSLALISS